MKNGKYTYENYTIIHLPTFAANSLVKIFYNKTKPFKVLNKGNVLYFKNIDDVLEFVNPPAFIGRRIYEYYKK